MHGETSVDPYRYSEFRESVKPTIFTQMYDACLVLRQWRRWDPVIAGGALWSWADEQLARDIDIFAKSTWRSRRRAKKLYGQFGVDHMPEIVATDSYGGVAETGAKTHRFMADLPRGGRLDFILTKWRGTDVVKHFDYEHCAVAFGVREYSLHGVTAWMSGKLNRQYAHSSPRREAIVWGKIATNSLWGQISSMEKICLVISTLTGIYRRIEEHEETSDVPVV